MESSAAPDPGGKQVMIGAMFASPGPASVMLPPTVGAKGMPAPGLADLDVRRPFNPAYSCVERHELKEIVRSPGPKYGLAQGQVRTGVHSGPKYSLTSRPQELKTDVKPGPDKYTPHNPSLTSERQAPAYTIRPKTEDKADQPTPAPNEYALPPLVSKHITYSSPGMLKSSEQWSLTGRSDHGSFTQVIKGIPGPGAHRPEDTTNATKIRAPKYSLRARAFMPGSKTAVPGPKYSTRNMTSRSKKRTTGGTFGAKASPYMFVAIE